MSIIHLIPPDLCDLYHVKEVTKRRRRNGNGLLRQYFPKGTSLLEFNQADLDAVAVSLNTRPRKTLDFATPEEHFKTLLAGLAGKQTKSSGVFVPELESAIPIRLVRYDHEASTRHSTISLIGR